MGEIEKVVSAYNIKRHAAMDELHSINRRLEALYEIAAELEQRRAKAWHPNWKDCIAEPVFSAVAAHMGAAYATSGINPGALHITASFKGEDGLTATLTLAPAEDAGGRMSAVAVGMIGGREVSAVPLPATAAELAAMLLKAP